MKKILSLVAGLLLTASLSAQNAPVSLTVTDAELTSLTVSATANDAGDDIIVAYTTEAAANKWTGYPMNYGKFGRPTAEVKAGDAIDGGGTVAYVGPADGLSEITGLDEGHYLFLCAWGTNGSAVSTDSINVVTSTACQEDWTSDFTGMSYSYPVFGFNTMPTTNNWATSRTAPNTTTGNLTANTPGYIETPWIYLSDGFNRVSYDIAMVTRGWMIYSYEFGRNDVVRVEVTNDGENYTTIKEYNYDDCEPLEDCSSASDFKTEVVKFSEFSGEKVRVRFYFDLHQNSRIVMQNITLEAVPDCDYPVDVKATEIDKDQATITWTPQGEEDAWQISYKKSDEEEWSSPVTVQETSYTLSGLMGLTKYDVRVRAYCSATSQSKWSPTGSFVSGMAAPFKITFSEQDGLSDEWLFKTGELATPTELTDGGGWEFFSVSFFGRKTVMQKFSASGAAADWFITPKFTLNEGTNYNVEFTISQFYAGGDDFEFYVVLAKDGETFNEADVLYSAQKADIVTKETVSIPLSGISGEVCLGLYAKNSEGSVNLVLQDLAVLYAGCEKPTSVEITPSIGGCTITCEGDACGYKAYYRLEGTEDWSTAETSDDTIELTGLDEGATYEFKVVSMCSTASGDYSESTDTMTFTTLETTCFAPEEITVDADIYEAKVKWDGDADNYEVAYRLSTEEEWTTVEASGSSVTLSDLDANATYYVRLRSICAPGDSSAWSETQSFYTGDDTYLLVSEDAIRHAVAMGMTRAHLPAIPTSEEKLQDFLDDLNVYEYFFLETNYDEDVTDLVGDISTWDAWTSNQPVGTSTGQHWSGDDRAYYEQGGANWAESAWQISYSKTVSLPAGMYNLRIAGRSATETTARAYSSVNGTEVEYSSHTFPSNGDTGRGIDKNGSPNFNPYDDNFANDGIGRGWQWRYVPVYVEKDGTEVTFTLYAETAAAHQWCSFCDVKLYKMNDGEGEITGINEIGTNATSTDIYSLDGKLVRRNATSTKGLKSGLYIVNGKKVSVK